MIYYSTICGKSDNLTSSKSEKHSSCSASRTSDKNLMHRQYNTGSDKIISDTLRKREKYTRQILFITLRRICLPLI